MSRAIVYFDGTIDGEHLRISQTEETGPNGNVWLENLRFPPERDNYSRTFLSLAFLDLLACWTTTRTRKGLGVSFVHVSRATHEAIWKVYPEAYEGTEIGASFVEQQAERERAARAASVGQ